MGAPLSALVALGAALQVPQATVVGSVRDADTGAPIHGATVALADLERGVVTADDGSYELAGIPAGR